MKRIILSFIASIAMLAFFTNCNDDDNPLNFSLNPSDGLVIGEDGGADVIEIKSSQRCWIERALITNQKDTIEYTQGKYMLIEKDWYYFDIRRGNLFVKLDTNKTTDSWFIDLYITAGGESQKVGIVQNPQDWK